MCRQAASSLEEVQISNVSNPQLVEDKFGFHFPTISKHSYQLQFPLSRTCRGMGSWVLILLMQIYFISPKDFHLNFDLNPT